MASLIAALASCAACIPSAAVASASTTAQFNGVSCFAYNACVGVGSWRPNERAPDRQFAAAWNGQAWTLLPTPAGHVDSFLYSADCVVRFCLLVGEWAAPSGGSYVPLAEQWDKAGVIKDTGAPLPAGSRFGGLRSVSCLSATYCIAAGDQVISGRIRPLTMKFDGSSWSVIATPAPASPVARLTGVACVPRRFMADFWCQAVGWYQTPSGRAAPLVLSWDGVTWRLERVDNPNGDRASNQLRSVSCRQTLCLAVGLSAAPQNRGILSERLVSSKGGAPQSDDHVWRAETGVPRPPGAGKTLLNSVSCRFANVCKGAGTYYDRTTRQWRTLIEVWQNRWQLNTDALCFQHCTASVPNAPYPTNGLSGVSCVTYDACMAVGSAVGRRGPALVTAPLALWLAHTAGFKWVLAPSLDFSSS